MTNKLRGSETWHALAIHCFNVLIKIKNHTATLKRFKEKKIIEGDTALKSKLMQELTFQLQSTVNSSSPSSIHPSIISSTKPTPHKQPPAVSHQSNIPPSILVEIPLKTKVITESKLVEIESNLKKGW